MLHEHAGIPPLPKLLVRMNSLFYSLHFPNTFWDHFEKLKYSSKLLTYMENWQGNPTGMEIRSQLKHTPTDYPNCVEECCKPAAVFVVELAESKQGITHKDWNQEVGWSKRHWRLPELLALPLYVLRIWWLCSGTTFSFVSEKRSDILAVPFATDAALPFSVWGSFRNPRQNPSVYGGDAARCPGISAQRYRVCRSAKSRNTVVT